MDFSKGGVCSSVEIDLIDMAPEMRILLSVQVPSLVLGDSCFEVYKDDQTGTLPQLTHKFDTFSAEVRNRLQAVGVRSFIRGADTSLDSRALKRGKTIFRLGDPRIRSDE